jgi:hypothetical protein
VRNQFASLVLLFCVACGPPRFTPITSDGESGDVGTEGSSTASNSTDTSSTDTSSSTNTNGSFVGPSDDFFHLPECDPFLQDCPHGEKCVPYASSGETWDDVKCVPVLGDQATGEPCVFGGIVEATDDCDATSFCWPETEVDGEMVGTCLDFCGGSLDTPECPEGSECLISSDPVVTLCFPMCDPVAQDCADGLGCYWSGTAFNCIWTANPPGVAPGQPCEFVNECEPGSVCADAAVMPNCEGTGCCASFCDLDLGDAQCAGVPDTLCVPFWEQDMAPAGFEHVGICVVEPP